MLSEEDFRKLEELRDMLEEIIETIDLLLNPETLGGLREAEEDVKEGRVRSWNGFLKGLKMANPPVGRSLWGSSPCSERSP